MQLVGAGLNTLTLCSCAPSPPSSPTPWLPASVSSRRMYAFDVHCNAFFPMFLLLYVLQLVLSPLLLMHTFVSTLLSAGGWVGARAGDVA